MVMLTGRIGFTIIVMRLELAGFPVVQVSLELSVQVTVLPFAGAKEYVELVAPLTLLPFTFHWYDGVVPPLLGVAV